MIPLLPIVTGLFSLGKTIAGGWMKRKEAKVEHNIKLAEMKLQLKEKRLQALTRLACQILDGRVVNKHRPGTLTSTGYLLRHFLVKRLPENWGEAAEVFRPDPGDCENCPACLKAKAASSICLAPSL